MRSTWKKQTVVLAFVLIMTTTIFAMERNNNNADSKESRNNGSFETRSEYVDRYSQNEEDVGARMVEHEDSNESKDAELTFEGTNLEMQLMHNENFDNRPVLGDQYNLNDDDVAANMAESINADDVRGDWTLANKLENEDLQSICSQSVDSSTQKLIPTKDTECTICYDLISKDYLVQLNNCHIQFCMKCVKKHVKFEQNKKCPLCNAMIVSINNIPLTDILDRKRYPYPVKICDVKPHVEDPWGVEVGFCTIPFKVTRIDANKQFAKLGVEVGWSITKINNTSLIKFTNMTEAQTKYLKDILRRGDACTLTFNSEFINFEEPEDYIRQKIKDKETACAMLQEHRDRVRQRIKDKETAARAIWEDNVMYTYNDIYDESPLPIVVKIEACEYERFSKAVQPRMKVSKCIGVYYDKGTSVWNASRYSDKMKRVVTYGEYKTEREAARASDTLAKILLREGDTGRTRSGHKLNFADALLYDESKNDKKQSNILNFPDDGVENSKDNKKCENCDAENFEECRFCKKCDGTKRKRPHGDDDDDVFKK